MILYLTGASNSLMKSTDNPQTDPSKSLGGFISSTPVPNGSLDALFDLISSYTLEKRQKETIAVALVNRLSVPVTNVELKMVTDEDHDADFKISAVTVDPASMSMEKINSRYDEPFGAEFYDASFYRAAVDIEVTNPASIGEEIALFPFGISFEVQKSGIEGTWEAFEEAFYNDETYDVKRLSRNVFRIIRRDETVVEPPEKCYYVTTSGFAATFLGDLKNAKTGSVLIKELMQPGEAFGLWIQRSIRPNRYPSNERLIENFKNGVIIPSEEEVDMVIDYKISE